MFEIIKVQWKRYNNKRTFLSASLSELESLESLDSDFCRFLDFLVFLDFFGFDDFFALGDSVVTDSEPLDESRFYSDKEISKI